MKTPIRKCLESRRKNKIESAVAKTLSSNPPPDIKPDLNDIDQYTQLISLTQPRWSPDSGLAVVVALLCVSAAGFLWSARIPRTNVSLAVDTESMRGEFARDWEFNRLFQSSTMHFERLSTIEAPNLALSIHENDGDAWFKLDGGQLQLQSVQVRQNGSWEAISDTEQVSLFLGNGPVEGRVTVRGRVNVTAGPEDGQKSLDRQFDLTIPETITFGVKDPHGVPAQLTVHSPTDWSLGKLPVSNLGFSMEQPTESADKTLTSGIRSGSLQFSDTSWPPIQLFENELLAVHQSEKARIEVRGQKGLMHVTLNGPVRNVTIGDEQALRVLAPSYLEYFYNRKSWAFFWGAIVFLWGILWSIRKTVLR
jgi:hypothetical protein